MNRNHYFFRNPKYSTNHLCIPLGENSYGVFEKMVIGRDAKGRTINLEWWKMTDATPIAEGDSAEAAVNKAVEMGIKPYDIDIVVGGEPQ